MSHLYYMGQRLNGDKLRHAFLTEKDERVYFSRIRRVYIGHAYVWDVKKETIKVQPEQLDKPLHEKHDQWFAEELNAKREYRDMLALKRFAKHGTFGEVIRLLGPKVKRLMRSEVRALVEYLVEEARKEANK